MYLNKLQHYSILHSTNQDAISAQQHSTLTIHRKKITQILKYNACIIPQAWHVNMALPLICTVDKLAETIL